MRLYQPQLQTSLGSVLQAFSDSPASALGATAFNDLALGGSFGTIWAGQTFTAYIVCLNHTKLPASQVELHTTMLTNSGASAPQAVFDSRADAPSPRGPCAFQQLRGGDHGDSVIKVHMPQAGLHTLQVLIKYVDFHGTPREMKRYFKFEVHNPFATTLSTVPAQGHLSPLSTGTVVNAVMRNSTSDAVCLGDVRFQCEAHCEASLLRRSLANNETLPTAADEQLQVSSLGLPDWLAQAPSAVNSPPSSSPTLPSWHPQQAEAEQPLLMPGQEVEFSFLVVRKVVRPNDSKTVGDVKLYTEALGPVTPAGYEHAQHTVAEHKDATLGCIELHWTTHMGESGCWRSAPVVSSASCPQMCHIVSARTLRGSVLQATQLPISITHLPGDGSGEQSNTEYLVRVASKDNHSCAVSGEELQPSGRLAPCQVSAHEFSILPLTSGAHRLEVVVSRQLAEDASGQGSHELDRPIREGKPIAWNTVDVIVE